ncbi:MAG: SapC family protein, partial [Giesbergeria sp.]|nr:SapC family protein [Giesbergeria sp.]
LPLALLGASKGHNAYVRPSGHWMARYVPAHLRRYPFVMAEAAAAPQGEGASEISHIVVVDADAPHLSADEGDRLFNDAGEPSEALLKVQRVLMLMERDNLRTLAMVAQLEAANLLVPQQVTVAKKQGQHIGLQGLRVVDMERLSNLEPEALKALQQSGALALAYAHQLSLTNLQDGVLCEAPNSTAASAESTSSGSISFEGIDWSKF